MWNIFDTKAIQKKEELSVMYKKGCYATYATQSILASVWFGKIVQSDRWFAVAFEWMHHILNTMHLFVELSLLR